MFERIGLGIRALGEQGLESCRSRCADLEALIASGEAALGIALVGGLKQGRVLMNLHAAIQFVLDGNQNQGMTARDLADEINARDLYRKSDGASVEVNQIPARINNYRPMFEKDGPKTRLRQGGQG